MKKSMKNLQELLEKNYIDNLSCGVNYVEEGFDLHKKNEVSIRQSKVCY